MLLEAAEEAQVPTEAWTFFGPVWDMRGCQAHWFWGIGIEFGENHILSMMAAQFELEDCGVQCQRWREKLEEMGISSVK